MNQDNKQRSDTLEAEKPIAATPQQAKPQPNEQIVPPQGERQGETPRAEAPRDESKSPTAADPQGMPQQQNKAAPPGVQPKR